MYDVFITKASTYLPNEPVSNEEMESYLGLVNNTPSKARALILRNNKIKTRYYALDKNGNATHTNAQITAKAVEGLFDEKFNRADMQLLSCGTSSADQIQPSHSSMVHGELNIGKSIEVNTATGLCNSGMNALNYGFLNVKAGIKDNAVCVGSERMSAWMTADKFNHEAENLKLLEERPIVAFKREFLRWMLSDGAGAFLLENKPRENETSLKIEWIDFYSYAHEIEACMYSGCEKQEDGSLKSWAEYPAEEWLNQSIFALKQDTKLLDKYILVKGAESLRASFTKHDLDPDSIDHVLAHISSGYFKEGLKEEFAKVGLDFPWEKWFYNLSEVGNIGAGSIFIAVEQLMNSGKLKKGERIMLCIPESGRFAYSCALLTVC
ncbi:MULTISPECIES: beta-ketoacyl-ACP synthase III [Chryseobacterium]|uniref:3-oxoacyl-[acyl-carrier-protein] synthase 3 n=1 Tax=Chryseobacterium indoltheticum TaxID=254 RepID=A0A381F5Q8_9FLAO|nr:MULTISPECIES: beta-ketoacyl-ACP synthase III [Chryseobacterium]AZA72236.1 StlD/DarB family beta-ketosynthase [Chryseobacterium indoltheticum]MDQ8142813.1 beta-ketoacyl-ACP synthase III [Chryseobacterium sp. CFS15]SIR08094.1 3-oxoacyl-[acyl-carrier-protein] synthase-3 [Chryseobacterium indoltheticum]SUX41794.1 3-oxoacyl-[acyl-carrier-protein] synthase 3 [Chryseobacterium indoltheticum]